MISEISEIVLQLSVMSLVCGVVLSLIPDKGCKSVVQILCTAALISCILSPFIGFDFETFALESAKLHELEEAFSKNANEAGKRLNRLVIQEQYREYILDKALQLGLDGLDVGVDTQWNEEGLWIPYSVELGGNWESTQKQQLQRLLTDELGIPEERQHWKRE